MAQCCGDNSQPDSDVTQVWDAFNKLRIEGQLCDAVLEAGGRQFPVHRAIMAANSPYFRALFTNGMRESEEREVQIPEVDAATMGLIIDYIYTRTVRITMDNVFTLLPHADSFLIQGLVDQCCRFLSSALSPFNCIGILRFAQNYYRMDLITTAKKYILDNFKMVSERSPEYLTLLPEDLADFIGEDELNVRSEEEVWDAVMRWMDHNTDRKLDSMPLFLQRIRLGLLPYEFFVDKVSSHTAVCDNNSCDTIIKEAWDFLNHLQEFGNRDVDLNQPLVRPRVPHNVLFAIGGWSGGSPISFFESYDTRADRWFIHPTLEDSAPRAYHGMVSLNGLVYMLGGFDGTQYYNNTRAFNPVTKEWRDLAPMYTQRCYVSSAVANGHVYACGGYDGRQRLDSAERYDPESNQWTQIARMQKRRSDAGSDSIHGKVYIAGGFNGEECLSSCEMFDPESGQWSLVTPMTSPRSGVGVVTYRDCLYTIGGFDGERRLETGEKYCPMSRQWTPMADMYTARSNCAVAVLDNMIFLLGGFNGSYTIPHVECYDEEAGEWYDATDMNINRSALKACVISGLSNVKNYTYHGFVDKNGDTA